MKLGNITASKDAFLKICKTSQDPLLCLLFPEGVSKQKIIRNSFAAFTDRQLTFCLCLAPG